MGNEASIPVDLFNAGQVFACMGFLEATSILLGHSEGGFGWTEAVEPRFRVRSEGGGNPFEVVLDFLCGAQLQRLAPAGFDDLQAGDNPPLCSTDTFPGPSADRLSLPLRLVQQGGSIQITHWCDASTRNPFKMFAGQQRSDAITSKMLEAIRKLWRESRDELIRDPLGLTVPLGGSTFKLDARKAWTPIDAGYSPDEQNHAVQASPVVELLAAIGLEHARPDEFRTREVRYGVWGGLVPPALARAALGGVHLGIPMRFFRFTLALAGHNKNVTFAQEEATQ